MCGKEIKNNERLVPRRREQQGRHDGIVLRSINNRNKQVESQKA